MSKKATVISGLALLAAGVSLVLTIQEKKRNQKRSAATCDYIKNEFEAAVKAAADYTKNGVDEAKEFAKKAVAKTVKRIEDLEAGVIPDFEEARRAAESVNDFNRELSNLLNFDPMEAIRKEQQQAHTGGENK